MFRVILFEARGEQGVEMLGKLAPSFVGRQERNNDGESWHSLFSFFYVRCTAINPDDPGITSEFDHLAKKRLGVPYWRRRILDFVCSRRLQYKEENVDKQHGRRCFIFAHSALLRVGPSKSTSQKDGKKERAKLGKAFREEGSIYEDGVEESDESFMVVWIWKHVES